MKKWRIRFAFIFAVFLSLSFISLVSADVWDDLNAYYVFEETSGDLIDVHNDWDGTLHNGVTQGVTGKIGNAYHFDGTDDYIEIGSGALPAGTGDFTISLWVYFDDNVASTLFSKQINSNGEFWFSRRSNGDIILWFNDSLVIEASSISNIQTWEHYVLVRDGDTFKLYKNGNLVDDGTNSAPVLDTSIWFGKGYSAGAEHYGKLDEYGIWTRALTEGEISQLYNNGDGLSFKEVVVTLNYPQDSATFPTTNILFNASYSAIGYNLTNATLYIWNSTSLFATNTTNITGTSNETIWNITNFELGNYEWNVYACSNDSSGYVDCKWAISNYTFSIGATVNSISYNNETYETASETFQVNISSVEGYTPTNAFLVYDGVEYEADIENIEENNYSISATMDIPTETGDKDFYFKWNLEDFIQYTNNYTQTIKPIIFGICNSTLNVPFINITFKDEKTLNNINATLTSSTWHYYLGSGNVNKTYSYSTSTNHSNYTFCFSPEDLAVNIDMSLKYYSEDYPLRNFIYSREYTNDTTTQVLYLLDSFSGRYTTFQVLSPAGQPLEGVFVTGEREILGNWTLVVSGTTGSAGGVSFWVYPDYQHRFTFSKEGYETLTKFITPSESAYTEYLNPTTLATNVSDYSQGINYYISPEEYVLANGTTYTFWFNLTSSYWDLDSFGFILKDEDSNLLGSNSSTVGTGGNISFSLNTGNNETIVMSYSWVINGSYVMYTRVWSVGSEADTGWSLKTFFEDLTTYMKQGMFGLNEFSRTLLIFLFIFISVGLISYYSGMYSPAAVMSMVFVFVAFFDVGLQVIPNPINAVNHFPTIFIGLLTIGVWVWEFK